MNKYIAILLLAFSGSAYAEAYLCIPEAAAGISYNYKQNGSFKSSTFDQDQYKFLQTNESGKWIVKIFEFETVHFQFCVTEFYCVQAEGDVGEYFFRSNKNRFEALIFGVTNLQTGTADLILYMGKCSKI